MNLPPTKGKCSSSKSLAFTNQAPSYLLGLTAPVGPGTVRVSYNDVDLKNSGNDAQKFAIGYVYDLSKRTAIYGTYAHVKNKGAAAFGAAPGGLTFTTPAGQNVNGYEFGVRHSF